MLSNHDIEDLFRHPRKRDQHQRAHNRAHQHPSGEEWIALQIGKNAPDGFHRKIVSTSMTSPSAQAAFRRFALRNATLRLASLERVAHRATSTVPLPLLALALASSA